MIMDFRQRLEQSRNRPVSDDMPGDAEEEFSCPYFATDKARMPVCLELRLPDGARKALPYAYFNEISFDADNGIEILTTNKTIIIKGRNLSRLFDYLAAYRVRYVQVNVGNDGNEDEHFVKEIIISEMLYK